MIGAMSYAHWAIVAGVVVLLFGRSLVSGLMGDIGKSLKILKDMGKDEEK